MLDLAKASTVRQKVLIYCRVSDTKQKTEGHGLDSQEHRCRQWATLRDYDVGTWSGGLKQGLFEG